jgi:hypothetical protein
MTETYAAGTPSWVDLGTQDVATSAAFYTGLFGWTYQAFGEDMGNYGMFFQDGKQVAGIGPGTDSGWTTYFAVDDVDAVAALVEANGGSIEAPPLDVGEEGRMAVFVDPAGARWAVWQAGNHTGAQVVNEPVSLGWSDLASTDLDAAKRFYPAVLGVATRDVEMGPGAAYTLFEVAGQPVAGAAAGESSMWNVYFDVADCNAVVAAAVAAGAKVVSEPVDIPAGRLATLADPMGSEFAVIQPNPDMDIS